MATVRADKFTIASGIVGLILVVTTTYTAIHQSHTDSEFSSVRSEIASLRASLESATVSFQTQSSRIDTAYTEITSIARDTAATKANDEYVKNDAGEIKAGLKQFQEDPLKIKSAVH